MKKLLTFTLSFLASSMMTSILFGTVYIRSDGPSNGDGKSWETAFNSIDAALANIPNNPADTTFWVAAGNYSPITTYSPSGVPGGAAADLYPNGLPIGFLTYNLPDGIKIYGGFRGNEKHLSDRCTIPNPLLELDRECSSNSKLPSRVADFALTVLNGGGSNSWHVVTVGNDIDKTGAHVGLFDLTIRGGYADGPDKGKLDSLFSVVRIKYAHDAGGGIYARFGSVVDLFNVQFTNNASSAVNARVFGSTGQSVLSGGGAIAEFDENTVINVKNSYFTSNSALFIGGGGGAIESELEASLNVKDCIFSNNLANRAGGAIRAKDSGDIHVKRSFFARNIAQDFNAPPDQAGGAIDVFQGNLFVESSTFLNNQGVVGGGAIFFHTFLDTGTPYFLDVNHCSFKSNRAGPFGGGAIFISGLGQNEGSKTTKGSKATIRNSQFSKNRGGLGGAIYNSSYETEIERSAFSNNLADAWGGAIAADNFAYVLSFPPIPFDDRPVTQIKHCSFKSNKTRGQQPVPFGFSPFFTPQGILNIFAELVPVFNGIPTTGTVDEKIVTGGGGIAVLLAGVAKISDCTFIGNEAITGTGGAILVGGATGTITKLDTGETFKTFDFASAFVKNCKFKDNCPNTAKAVDLAGVGKGPDGITLVIER